MVFYTGYSHADTYLESVVGDNSSSETFETVSTCSREKSHKHGTKKQKKGKML